MRGLAERINYENYQNLPILEEVIDELPISEKIQEFISKKRQEIESIISGEDERLLVIVGPCSIHNTSDAFEYAKKLASISDKYSEDLLIVMRTYFEKPRTRVGWKGLLIEPDLTDGINVRKGIYEARSFLEKVLNLGLPTATEFLDSGLFPYISDLICWGAIGARTTESQPHRQMASGLPCPIGFKNGTDGNIDIAIDAIVSSLEPHVLYTSCGKGNPIAITTSGNKFGHIILRGGKEPNYTEKHVKNATKKLKDNNLNSRVIIDCSHGNSGKVAKNQTIVANNVAWQISNGEDNVSGVMIESFLVSGKQCINSNELIKGQSVTDDCLCLDDTLQIIDVLANAIKNKRYNLLSVA
ncbi:3-deoxy-7-phosphoheptulonate synthase [Vibrio bivalvicida]|uniref:Phospho-2-dehydro-3-deoxyheptonate aldolase n=1 Tax=Vibrio bivalvicida TaxID=1276888 RepID=A0A177XU50_9VIBR|nr:3-deoxy-7-phosphoheptulonate synthase [Vibrio bivalvicida]OAJ92138.1 phospho-2-dehydro-3-deoxyheptonate aldolase [Vibrio bivalvicida]